MDFFDVIKNRFSCRRFLPKAVEPEKLEKLYQAIRSAPTAGNLQAYKVYVVKDLEKKQALAAAASGQNYIAEASVGLVFCALPQESSRRYRERGARLYAIQDATIATVFAHLTATALGLASVWIGAFDEAAVQDVLGIPDTERPVAILPIGYAAESKKNSARRSEEEIFHA